MKDLENKLHAAVKFLLSLAANHSDPTVAATSARHLEGMTEPMPAKKPEPAPMTEETTETPVHHGPGQTP